MISSLIIAFTIATITSALGISPQGPSNIVQAKDILNKIEAHEPVDYNNSIVIGDLNLSKAALPSRLLERNEFEKGINYLRENSKLVDSSIKIKNSEIKGAINCNNVIFENSTSFENTKFSNNSYFRGAQFQKNTSFYNVSFKMNAYYEWVQFGQGVDFKKSNFSEESHFLEAQFNGIAHFDNIHFGGFQDFRNARFNDLAYFEGTNFSGDSYFDRVQFLRDVDFRKIKLGGSADFSDTKFNANMDFRGAEFLHEALFSNSQFMSETYFSKAKFNNSAEFLGAKFGGNAYFWNTQFNGTADFWNSQFNKKTDFTEAIFGSNASFDSSEFSDSRNSLTAFSKVSFNGNTSFAEAQLSPISDFRYSNFNNSLNLTHVGFDRMEIRWNQIIRHKLICDESVYVSLVKNFENMGQFEDADNCFYQYRRYKQENSEFGLSRFIDTMAGITCGYGVRPQYIAVWSILLILVFSVFFFQARAIKKSEPMHAIVRSRRYNKISRDPTFWDALYFSILVFFVSLPPQEWRAIERWRFLVMLEDLVGWLFITLFVVVLGHIMIR